MARPVCISTPSAPRHSGRALGGMRPKQMKSERHIWKVLTADWKLTLTVALPVFVAAMWFGISRRFEDIMPNKPDAVNPAMALRFAIEDQRRRVTDLERWLHLCKSNDGVRLHTENQKGVAQERSG